MISIKNLTKEFSGQKVLDGIDIDIEKVKEMFTPAKNAFNHCCNELNNYIQEQYKGALEDEKERIRRKSC